MARSRKKKINRKLVTILLIVAVPILLFLMVAADSYRPFLPGAVHKMLGRDPEVLLVKAQAELVDLEAYYADLKKQVSSDEDVAESSKKWMTLFTDSYLPRAKEVGQHINDVRRFGKKNTDVLIRANNEMVRLHLVAKDYESALGVWNEIIKYDGGNYDAWKKKADLYLERSEIYSGLDSLTNLEDSAKELIELKPEDPYGYALKLLAVAMKLKSSLSQDVLGDKNAAESQIAYIMEKFPTDVKATAGVGCYYSYLSQNAVDLVAKQEILAKSATILKSAITANPDNAEAYENYFKYYLEESRNAYQQTLSKTFDPAEKKELATKLAEFNAAAESEYNVAMLKFKDNPDLKVSKASYLSTIVIDDYSEIVSLYEQAVALEPDNLPWCSVLGKLYYIISDASSDTKLLQKSRQYLRRVYYGYSEQMNRSIEGRRTAAIRNIETIPFLSLVNAKLASDDKSVVTEMQEIATGLAENYAANNPLKLACEGLYLMTDGQKQKAIQKLYSAANTKENSSDFTTIFQAEVRWVLYGLLKDSQYGLLALQNAASSYATRPRSAADFVELVDTYLAVASGQSRQEVVQLIETFGSRFEKDAVYYPQIRKQLAQALISVGNKDEARKVLEDISVDSAAVELMRCELIEDEAGRVAALEGLIKKYPADREIVDSLYGYYIKALKSDPAYLPKIRELIAAAHKAAPDEYFFTQELAKVNEPDPLAITKERMFEIQLATINGLSDGFEQAMMAGRLYMARAGQVGVEAEAAKADKLKALEYFEKAAGLKAESVDPLTAMVIIYIGLEDYDKAKSVVEKITKIDDMSGKFALVDLYYAQKEYEQAEKDLSAFLTEYPLSARGHHVLAKIYTQLGRKADASRELELSLSQDRFNAEALLDHIIMLNEDYVAIGLDSLGPEKVQTMMSNIEQLMNLSPNNIQGVRFFIQYAPLWAKVLDIQLYSPNISAANAEMYRKRIATIEDMVTRNVGAITNLVKGNEAMYLICVNALGSLADLNSLKEKKPAYIDTIDKLYQKALADMPGSSVLIYNYETFCRQTGRSDGKGVDKLKAMLDTTQGTDHYNTVTSLARFYITDGDSDAAIALLTDEIAKSEDEDQRLSMRSILASVYKGVGQYDKAIEVYAQQRREKDTENIMTLQIEAMMDGGYSEKALPLLAEMEEKYPDENKVYLLKAKYALRETDYEKAVEYADKALSLKPGDLVGLEIKGRALFYSDKLYEAQQVINEMRSGTSADSNLGRAMLAQIYSRNRKYDEAIIELRKGLDSQPGNVELNDMMVNLLTNLKRWEELVSYYQKQINIYPDRYDIYANCARAMLSRARELASAGNTVRSDEQVKAAIALIEKAIVAANANGTSPLVLFDVRAELIMASGNYDAILKDIEANSDMVNSNPQLLLRKMEVLYRSGKKEDALGVLTQLLGRAAKDPLAETLAEKVVSIISPAELLSWAKSNIDTTASKSLLCMIESSAARNAGQTDLYLSAAEKAMEYAKDDQALTLVAKIRLAVASVQAEKYDRAIELYRDLCQQMPSNYSLLNNLAYALLSKGGNEKEALEVAKKAYSLARLEPMILDTYGMALLQNGKADEARLMFGKAIQEMQRNNVDVPVEFEYHLAQAMVAAQRKEEALELLNDLVGRAKLSQSQEDQKMVGKVEELLAQLKK